MANLNTIIDLVHPTVSGSNVITSDQIWVIFDREVDQDSVENGGLFVTGPDFDTWSGPDLQIYHDYESIGEEEDILESPTFHGVVQGTFSFERIATDSLTTVSSLDTIGSGFLYRTKAIFTPSKRLEASQEYKVYITGDEDLTDDYNSGVLSRTVFDTVASGANLGTGEATFYGGYTGDASQNEYHIIITTEGEVGTAKFQWWKASDVLSIFGPLTTKRSQVLLSDGVSVAFTEGNYELGDKWYALVKAPIGFTGNIIYPFSTGTGSIQQLPDSSSTTVLGDSETSSTSSSTSATSFAVVSTTPANQATHQTIPDGDYQIIVACSADIDPSSVTGVASLNIEPVNGDESIPASGVFTDVSLSASGQNLSILVPSGILNPNNLVTITVDDALSSDGGLTLSSDYEFWFTTTYTPRYCTPRKLRLEYGAYISNVIDDTLNLALFEASLYADAIKFGSDSTNYFKFARSQWVCCKAAEILLSNTIGGNNLRSKKLGDLEVTYNTTASSNDGLDRALACQQKWETTLQAGGNPLQSPRVLIKGSSDPDRPYIGRRWAESPSIPASNNKVKPTGRRRWTGYYNRTSGGHYPGGRNW